jgi:hypothetical protein
MNMMPWQRRVDTRRDDMAHGITFLMHERRGRNVRAEVTTGDKKIHTEGAVSLTLALNQYKYGDEIIFQLFTREAPRILERRADGWTRAQIYGGPADMTTVAMLRSCADDLEIWLLGKILPEEE